MGWSEEDPRPQIYVHTEAPSDDGIRTFYEVPDTLAMMLWGGKSTTFCEALGDALAELRRLRGAPWACEGCGTTDVARRYDNGPACEECVLKSFGESG